MNILKTSFYGGKTGFKMLCVNFVIQAQKHRLGVLVRAKIREKYFKYMEQIFKLENGN